MQLGYKHEKLPNKEKYLLITQRIPYDRIKEEIFHGTH